MGSGSLMKMKTLKKIINSTDKMGLPLTHFLYKLYSIPGYDLDDLEKKNILLAMAMANRPEMFLKPNKEEEEDLWPPIIDYHLMRIALRLGLVDLDSKQEDANIERRWINKQDEEQIRMETYTAIDELINLSKKPMSFVDKTLWMARKYCPEMEKPDCEKCIFTDVCDKRTELFQPVFRTTNY